MDSMDDSYGSEYDSLHSVAPGSGSLLRMLDGRDCSATGSFLGVPLRSFQRHNKDQRQLSYSCGDLIICHL